MISQREPLVIMTANILDVSYARANFPGVTKSSYVLADNAGGSQIANSVVLATADYLINSNVQPKAGYPTSQVAAARVQLGVDATAALFNVGSDEVAFGTTTEQLLANLGLAMTGRIKDGDEVIVTGEHESIVSPFTKIANSRNPKLKCQTWFPKSTNPNNPYAVSYVPAIPDLLAMVTAKTRIFAFVASSNITGEVLDVQSIVKQVRDRKKALANGVDDMWVVVDVVAFVPHKSFDVSKWDVDFAVFSYYKLYGPHTTSALYTRKSSLPTIDSVVFWYLSRTNQDSPSKLEVGGRGYEGTYSCSYVLPYLYSLAFQNPAGCIQDPEELLTKISRADIRKALDHTSELFSAHLKELTTAALTFLTSDRIYKLGVRVVGPETADIREPTISFLVVGPNNSIGMGSKDFVDKVDKLKTVAIRYGVMQTYTLVGNLPDFTTSDPPEPGKRTLADGVIRFSLVHYNTLAEVQVLITALDTVLSAPRK
ncbi:PLP-dependent transferase [Ramaria rubella]|nr:PLP-dependent transferase [Ramaria rubella]